MNMGVKEVALFFGVTEKTVYRWLAEQKIPAFRVGSQYRFSEAALVAWAASSGQTCPQAASAKRPLSVSQTLRQGGIFYRVEGDSVETTIRSMVQLARIEPLDEASLVTSLLERETMEPTAMGNGIALPHLRNPIPEIRRPLLALGFLESPVDFGALDRCPVHALFLLLSPTPQDHLAMLSRLSHLLRDARLAGLIQQQALRNKLLATIESLEKSLPDRS